MMKKERIHVEVCLVKSCSTPVLFFVLIQEVK